MMVYGLGVGFAWGSTKHVRTKSMKPTLLSGIAFDAFCLSDILGGALEDFPWPKRQVMSQNSKVPIP